MDEDALKKMGAVCSAFVVVLAFLSLPVMYLCIGAPISLTAATFLLLLAIGILLVYYTRERFKEIDGGLEDDLDDY